MLFYFELNKVVLYKHSLSHFRLFPPITILQFSEFFNNISKNNISTKQQHQNIKNDHHVVFLKLLAKNKFESLIKKIKPVAIRLQ